MRGKGLSVAIWLELLHEGWAEPRRQVLVCTFLRVQKAPLRPRSQLALQLGSHRVSPAALGKCVQAQLG